MNDKLINELIEWANEVEKKCSYSVAHILAAHARVNSKVKNTERAKVIVANELVNGGD